jgi:hypothetical protein
VTVANYALTAGDTNLYVGQYLGAMTWAALQASAYANGSVGLGALDADATVFITDWKVSMTPSADKSYWTCGSPIQIAQFGASSLNDVVYGANATTVTAVASASAGAKTRLTWTGHGLTNTNDGVNVYVSAGTNWVAGLYPMTYVDANTVDLSVAWNASFGNPTVRTVTGSLLTTTLRTVTVPAKLLQATSLVEILSTWQFTSSANNRYMTIHHNTSDVFQFTSSSTTSYQDYRWIRNRGAKNSQIGPAIGGAGLSLGQTPSTRTIDTDAASTINFVADLRVVNEFMRIAAYTVKVLV